MKVKEEEKPEEVKVKEEENPEEVKVEEEENVEPGGSKNASDPKTL
jgi:hypothetical protein